MQAETTWQTPSREQFAELLNEEYTTREVDVDGVRITSIANGNSIFLRYAGYRDGTSIIRGGNYGGYYWTRTLIIEDSGRAWVGLAHEGECKNFTRQTGYSIRPVRKQ